MSQPALHHVLCPDTRGRRMAYWQWGDPGSDHLALCVHGLTRQGRDFDVLAQALVAQAQASGHSLRVVCPDVAGRGHSDRLADPAQYHPLTYVADIQALLAQLHAQARLQAVDWVGTSMGGIIGMLAAAQTQVWPAPLRRLVLNDIGPELSWAGLERIRGYVGRVGPFPSLQQGLALLRERMASFGPHSDPAWLALNLPMFRPAPGQDSLHSGPVVLHYDPAIAEAFQGLTPESNAQGAEFMRAVYGQIQCPTLLLRGAQSELLSRETAQAMTQSGPRASLLEIPGVGHAPTLIADEQVRAVSDFLLRR
jgi:pimeloyl-ACP methyl ester carboxylesterase